MTADVHAGPPALVPYIRTSADGQHYLAGSRCASCDEVFVGDRRTCPACYERDRMIDVRLARTGRVYAFTVVFRSFPGVRTPFIDVTVDLDGGAHVKGTLEGVDPTPDAIGFDLPVELVFREVTPVNAADRPYLSYVFVPQRPGTGAPR
jgi:hypothetical protein